MHIKPFAYMAPTRFLSIGYTWCPRIPADAEMPFTFPAEPAELNLYLQFLPLVVGIRITWI